MEILEGGVLELRDAVRLAQEVKAKDDFTLRLLQSEMDSSKSQLVDAWKGFKSDLAYLNSNKELGSTYKELDRLQQHGKRLAQELVVAMEKNRPTALDLSEARGALEELQRLHQHYKDSCKDSNEELRKSNLAFLA
ncbi:uncharacterized protein LOC122303069 [Carya illinoinensis]|uniref:uncharacterized protein LOC122303069 n=1 Tax=Carya illinoinensis TaxID=32201 RepID=UPI001C719B57|nr:uncharacterized protein LOC122303069 [Carya illinoinensis]